MVETAVINASILTVTLTFVGFSILTLAHRYDNVSFLEQCHFPEKLVGFFYHMAYWRFALEPFENMSERFKITDKQLERHETPLVDKRRQEMVWPNFHLAFLLLLFTCGFFSSPTSQEHVGKETKPRTGGNGTGLTRLKKKYKGGNKNRKRMRRRTKTRSKKR